MKHTLNSHRGRTLSVLLSIATGFHFVTVGMAVPPTVKTVPWVAGNPLFPHDTYGGRPITLKGTSDQEGANFRWIWDFGDGSPVTTGTVTDRYAIEASHSYTGTIGIVYTARLTVTNTSTSEAASKPYYVIVRDTNNPTDRLNVQVNIAIDEGLWYLHKSQYRFNSGGTDLGDWTQSRYGGYAASSYYGISALNLNAFEANGHLESGDPENPYTETVQRTMRRLFSLLTTISVSTQQNGICTFNPDANTNGFAIAVNQGLAWYQGGMFMDAIVASGTPNAVATNGPANVSGRTYKDIVQDMVEAYAWAQYDSSPQGGGWRYDANQAPDNSACQWAAIGMIPAERNWGCIVPDCVKPWNVVWLKYTQETDGRFGYVSTGSYPWGPFATTPSGLVQLALNGIGRGTVLSTETISRWDLTETFLRNNFNNAGGAGNSIKDYYYGLFSFVKSMIYHNTNGVPAPITFLQSKTAGVTPIDWYGDLTNGVARTLVDDQNINGYWYAHNFTSEQYPMETAMAIQMLARSIVCGSPVAVARAIPNPATTNQMVVLDGSDSFHTCITNRIISWEWDLNCDGTIDAIGPKVTTNFPTVGTYCVRLRVTDNDTPPRSAEATITVKSVPPPAPPTADAGGPYVFCPQAKPWYLDGRRSTNPDEGAGELGAPGDTIVEYRWDLDGNNDFNDATGAVVNVTAYFENRGPGHYLVQLLVRDQTSVSFPSLHTNDLTGTDSAEVIVTNCTCATLSAACQERQVLLTWDNVGAAYYNVYRSTNSGGPYASLATLNAGVTNYVDTNVVPRTTYYYVVRPAELNTHEICQSAEASTTPYWRPVAICQNLILSADTGVCQAAVSPEQVNMGSYDPDGDPITFTLQPPGPYSVGVTLVTLIVTGHPPTNSCQKSSLTNVCQVNIEVRDRELPAIACSTNITRNTDPGRCSAVVPFSVTATDNCPGVQLQCAPPSGSEFQKGQTTISCTAIDVSGNSNQCSFTITVVDAAPPAITCPASITANTDAGQCSKSNVTYTATATDNCPGATLSCSPPSGSTFAKGVSIVTCTATDASGNTNACSFSVTIRDMELPVVTCPANITANTDAGQCTKSNVTYTAAVTDNCPGATVSCLPASGSTFGKGVTTVTCTATDASGNTNACSFTVAIRDMESPVTTCPANITANTDTGQCTKSNVTYAVTASDNCPGATVTCAPVSGSTFGKGVTTVTCTATDASGNTNACSFTVTIRDMESPVITCTANITANTDAGQCSKSNVTYTATVTDNCPGATVTCAPASGSTFAKGATMVTCTTTDASGNTNACSFTVTVRDMESPVISCPANIVANTDASQCTKSNVTYAATATDNCPGVTFSCSPASGSTFAKGVTTITCTATDTSGNTNTCGFTVTIRDMESPVVTCPANIIANTDAGQCTKSNVTYTVTANDNCPGVAFSCTPASGSTFAKGVTNVTCTVTDTSGNSNRCSFTVTVRDTVAPNIVCPSNLVVGCAAPGGAPVSYIVTAIDNCDTSLAAQCTPPSGSFFPIGDTTVNCAAVDSASNSVSCSFRVTVNTPPVAQAQTLTTDEDQPLSIHLTAQPNEGPLTFTIVSNPSHGTLTGAPPNVVYAPARDYCGPDEFVFQVSKGQCDPSRAVVRITVLPVNDCPVAHPQLTRTSENVPVALALAGSDADSVCGSVTLTYTVISIPAHGTLSGAPPNLTYTPALNYCGPDSFVFRVSDGVCGAAATNTIEVACVNTCPVPVIHIVPETHLGMAWSNVLVISPNNLTACVILDGSGSHDVDHDSLTFLWYADLNGDGLPDDFNHDGQPDPIGVGPVTTNCFDIGTVKIWLVVSDGQCMTNTAVTVDVITGCDAVEVLIAKVDAANIERKNKRPLIASLKAACASFDRGNFIAGLNQLEAFINKTGSQISRTYPEVAQDWINTAQAIIQAFEGTDAITPRRP